MKVIEPRTLKGRSALSLLADWLEELAAKHRAGEETSILLSLPTDDGTRGVFEFRAYDVPGVCKVVKVNKEDRR